MRPRPSIKHAEREADKRVQAALSLQGTAEKRVAEMEKQCERAAGLADAQQQLTNEVEVHRTERNQALAELSDERNIKQDLQVLVSRLRAEKEGLENEVSELRSQRDSLTADKGRMEADRNAWRIETEQMKVAIGAKQKVLTTTERSLEIERERSARLAQEVQSHLEAITSSRDDYQELLARYDNERDAHATAKEDLASVRAQLFRTITEMTALAEERDRLLSGIDTQLKVLTKNAQKN